MMKYLLEIAWAVLLAGVLTGVFLLHGAPACCLCMVFAAIWFVVALILLSRPPAIPMIHHDFDDPDETHISRNDVIPVLIWQLRVRYALVVACGISVVLLVLLMQAN